MTPVRRFLSACLMCVGLLVASDCAGPASAAGSAAQIAYVVTPEVRDGTLQDLALSLDFTAEPSGITRIDLPSTWSGATQLYKAVHDITADGARLHMEGPATVVLTSAPHAHVSLRYKVRQDFDGEPAVAQGNPYRPITRPKWFTAIGWALFPEIEGRREVPVSFRWGPMPAGWNAASDLDHRIVGVRRVDDLLDSVLTGGEAMQVLERPFDGGRIRIAFHGRWKVSEQQIADLQAKIARTSADFWKDHGEEFFVAVTPLQAPPGQTAQFGVGLGDAFSLWATSDVDEASLRHILAHEHQHVWFPTRVGGVRSGPDEPLDFWLSEGFTDFYTLRILLRSGVYSLEDFTADYNHILRAYALSPVREAPNATIRARFWKDRAVADLPYQRGLLLAALWDDRLRRSSGGKANLDQVVLTMKALAGRPGAQGQAPANLKTAFRTLGGGDLGPDLTRYVDAGHAVVLPADLFGACAVVRTYATGPGKASYQAVELTPGMSAEQRAGCARTMSGG
jgi:predicted metalloprotease with PDZ domain